ncbi:hypothetical protein EDC01DRAFT_724080 [Geopyxis carbonaria]|nr:hypothetical protein EDC01DRAFT_724080 [Geopyxis carbonaria]
MRLTIFLPLLSAATAIFALPAPPAPSPASYDGVQVLRITLGPSDADATLLSALLEKLDLATWTDVVKPNFAIDFEVPPSKLAAFQRAWPGEVTVMHADLGASIRAESAATPAEGALTAAAAVDMSWFNSYHSYADHISYLSALVAQYPANTELITAGTSYEGRPITGVHIFGSGGKGSKPAVIWHGTVHAREWITTMEVEFMAYTLLSSYTNSTSIRALVDSYDYYIFPIVNPDGFAYTQTSTRLWRKNRQPGTCVGVDLNRNWNAHWAVTGGASTSPCAETYKGPSAGSSPEVKALAAFQDALGKSAVGAKFYMDFHSYSQLFMSPYGWSCTAVAADNAELVALERGAAAAIEAVYGTSYDAGPICTTIYQATGGSVDYSYDTSGIKYSFTTEGRDTGAYGFVLPASQIYPACRELWEGVRYVLENMK